MSLLTAEEARKKTDEKRRNLSDLEIQIVSEAINKVLESPDYIDYYCYIHQDLTELTIKRLISLAYDVHRTDDGIKISWGLDEIPDEIPNEKM